MVSITKYRFEKVRRKKIGQESVPGVLLWLSKRLRKMKWLLLHLKKIKFVSGKLDGRGADRRQDLPFSVTPSSGSRLFTTHCARSVLPTGSRHQLSRENEEGHGY